jgi:conjugative relaxase-like TrwC/TraI family protein
LQIEAAHLIPESEESMTVSMRVMSAGDGYKYLLRTVVAGDATRSLTTPLTRYYSVKGTPPGRWIGSGIQGLGLGRIVDGADVTEPQLQLLIGMGRDPVTGAPLGRGYPVYGPSAAATSTDGRDNGKDRFEGRRRRAVAGYDFTFSIPKSASILWGISDATTQERIVAAHHGAVAQVVAFMEREVVATRTGAAAYDGAVAQVDVIGLIATAFDHFDSRAGDPHLHTHVVISNKVQAVLDGRWRAIDGRPMHAAVVALSELHETLFADALSRSVNVNWEKRDRGRDRNPAWAISSVPESLVSEFSTRSRRIDAETDVLIEAFAGRHGHRPNPVTIMKLRAQATLSTRPPKAVHSLTELTAEWRGRAERVLGQDATTWAHTVANSSPIVVSAADVSREEIDRLGSTVTRAVSEKRATWRHWNLMAEAARQTMPWRFASASDREAVVGLIVEAAERASLRITPPNLASTPALFLRDDQTSVFNPRHSVVFTSTDLLDAESRLLKRSADTTGPRIAPATLRSAAGGRSSGDGQLAQDQVAALEAIADSGRAIDVLVGPAGAGKTAAMNTLRRAWEAVHGAGSVVGLAPSATAAAVLAVDLGITTENLAKWWQDHLVHGMTFRADQLVIIDEASLAGTFSLDRISALTADAGAKVLLVGDHAQLQSVDAGGALSLLFHDRRNAPELTDIHRFVNEWEKVASLGLRRGDPESIDLYVANDRVREGSTEAMADAAYEGWRADVRAGKATVLVSDSTEAVASLNTRARTELILEGRVDALREVALHDGSRAAVGDTVTTRRNDRRLRAAQPWVRNGDRWTVIAVRRNGSVEARRHGRRWGSTVLLPAEYVSRHVDLGYAITSHRAQGITTDTAHVVVASGSTRENLYVAMTRGREANTAYVAIDRPDVAHIGPRPGNRGDATARTVLRGVLQHVGAELSAHETVTAEQDVWGSIARVAAEYETIAAAAQRDRWMSVVRECGLSDAQVGSAISSDAFGPLTAELRRAEAHHFDVKRLLMRVVSVRGFDDALDIAAVLLARIEAAAAAQTGAGRSRKPPLLLAGLIPVATGPMSTEMHRALDERRDLIEKRASACLDAALQAGEPWTKALGVAPRGSEQTAWRQFGRTVAAYRDRFGIVGDSALGPAPQTTAQKRDAVRARAALEAAHRLTEERAFGPTIQRLATGLSSAGLQF